MKNMKKMLALILALVMVLALGTTAFAEEGKGTITVSNSTVGATYSLYKVFSATVSADGNIAYKADAALVENDYFVTDSKLNVTVKEGAKAADGSLTPAAIQWLRENYVKNEKLTATMTGNGEAITFKNVDYGYYIVTSTVNNGAAVTVDSTKPDVTVVDKNQVPTWDNEPGEGDETGEDSNPGKVIIEDGKKVVVNSASYGDTVNFSISVNATAYVGKDLVTHYYIKDTLDDGFSFADNIVVKVGDAVLVEDTDYILTQNGNFFEIDIPFGEKYGSNAKIEVTYSATVEDDAVIAGAGNLNTANFTYSTDSSFDPNDPGYDPENPNDPGYPNPDDPTKPYDEMNKKTTTTYVYALGFHKVDGQTKESLADAEFSIKLGETVIGAVKNDDGTYSYTTDAAVDGYTTTFVSDADGLIVVKGLKAGSYTVTETKAPAGYNLLENPVTIETQISETSQYTQTVTTYYDKDGNVVAEKVEDGKTVTSTYEVAVKELIIENNAGTELPSTGGMGTTIFYVLGGLLVIVAVVLLITKKRMNNISE